MSSNKEEQIKEMIEHLSAKIEKAKRVQPGWVSVAPEGYQKN
jgi:hypothetical protein